MSERSPSRLRSNDDLRISGGWPHRRAQEHGYPSATSAVGLSLDLND